MKLQRKPRQDENAKHITFDAERIENCKQFKCLEALFMENYDETVQKK